MGMGGGEEDCCEDEDEVKCEEDSSVFVSN